MTAELIGARLTPNAALVRFRGSDDLTVPKVEKNGKNYSPPMLLMSSTSLLLQWKLSSWSNDRTEQSCGYRILWRRRQLPSTAPESEYEFAAGRERG
jgi:S-DNA-T family DNA segregation ATPase FtsK/SpoIIIE